MTRQAIFLDPSNRRGRLLSRLGWLIAAISTVTLATFLYGVFTVPNLPGLGRINPRQLFPIAVANPAVASRVKLQTVRAFTAAPHRAARRRGGHARNAAAAKSHVTVHTVAHRIDPLLIAPSPVGSASTEAAAPGPRRPLSIGFYDDEDAPNLAALHAALPHLDWVSPTWIGLDTADGTLNLHFDDGALALIRASRPEAKVLPLLQNIKDGTADGLATALILFDAEKRKALVQEIVATLSDKGLNGLVVNFEGLPAGAEPDLVRFLGDLKEAFRPQGLILAVAEPLANPSNSDAALSAATDFVILMAYDEHSGVGEPGPIASQAWYVHGLMQHLHSLEAGRTIVALGSFAYDWKRNEQSELIRFDTAIQAARDARASITFDRDLLNPHFAYGESTGKRHEVWLLDAVTAYNQVLAADVYRPAGYAVWRIGSEDPSIWSVLGRPYLSPPPSGISNIGSGSSVDYAGGGEIMQITTEPKDGQRTVLYDPVSHIATSETYTDFPSNLVVTQTGSQAGKVALTFDDGPSPDWTARILDILKDKSVKATFFIVGVNASAAPGLVKRMVAEGHDVGNHTFTHPNLATAPAELLKVELNATQRLFQALTGRAMRLFRPPYLGDAHPTDDNSLRILRLAQDLGYITVGLKVDPDDWRQPTPDQIIDRVMAAVTDPNPESRGQIVLLHDAGGDRRSTVEALPRLIDALRAKGFEPVPVSELAGLTQDQVMPLFPHEPVLPAVNSSVFLLASWLASMIHWFAIAAIVLGFGRLATLCSLAVWGQARASLTAPGGRLPRGESPGANQDTPPGASQKVSVLIPAFNEERVIIGSIRRILASTGCQFEIIVIDDGSNDRTADCVRETFADELRVRLIETPNCGKAHAVNIGLRQATGDVIVALDADTQFEPGTIARLLRWFVDPHVGAVAGNAKVGNRINLLTRWQALEYITAQNLERRALAALGCVTVVPGAVGAWRGSLLRELGGFPSDTLAEDQDLTIAVQRAGYSVRFDSDAVAWTEAPDTVANLIKQRFRWAFGTLQCLWKHHRVTFNPDFGALGLIALPQVWLFQILLSLLAPVIDLMLLAQIASSVLDYVQHGQQLDTTDIGTTLLYYAAFMLVDISAAIIAFGFERGEDWRLLWWLPLQRLGYRQLMYYVVVKAVLTAMMGNLVGWGKTERRASVVVAAAAE